MPSPPALALDGITKRFGPALALDGASLDVAEGSLHAVLGENGAGKTTLMRVAFGMVRPDAGTVRAFGVERRFASAAEAIAAGIGMVHQHFTIVPAMTVAENVALGGRGRYDARAAARRVREVGEAAGLALDPEARAGELGVAAQQRLEIVKALARDARLLILDEPGAVLAPAEARELLGWLRRFVDGGATVVLITHKLRDALAYADAVTVLRRGRTVGASGTAGIDEGWLLERMLGARTRPGAGSAAEAVIGVGEAGDGAAARDDAPGAEAVAPGPPPGQRMPPRPTPVHGESTPPVSFPRTPVAEAAGVAWTDPRGVTRLRDLTLALHPGELVGVAGVEGSGQHELLRLLAGRLRPTRGTLRLPPEIAFIPEDRHRDALLLDGSLVENLALRGAGARRGRIAWTGLARRAESLIARFDVRTGGGTTGGGPTAPARALSGGNQQKFVVARELAGAAPAGRGSAASTADVPPALVVAENPTRGLDVRATAAVLDRLRAARDAGSAVVVYSSDLDEVLALADRVLVVYDGRTTVLPPDRERVGQAMLGALIDD